MSDNINTTIDVALSLQNTLRDLAQMADSFKQSVLASDALKSGIDNMQTPLHQLQGGAVELRKLFQEMQAAAQGTGKALAAATTVRASRANLNSTDEAVSSNVINAQLSVQQKIAKAAADIVAEMELQTKLQLGIIDGQVLEYRLQQQNIEIVRLKGLEAAKTGVQQQRINVQLQQEIEARRLIEQQMQDLNNAAAAQVAREKELAAAEKQRLKDQAAATSEAERTAAAQAKATAAANTPQALSRAGKTAYEDAEALRKIKQGIVDLDTLAYQREQAQVEVGRLLQTQVTAQVSAQASLTAQLEKQYNVLRLIDEKEAEISSHSRLNSIFSTGGADLLKIQAQLIINYGVINSVLNSIRFGSTFVKDLDEQFHQLQAIGALTDTEMANLSKDILSIGENSKFSSVEIAKTAVVLAQAGLSGVQIRDSLKSIVDLATASGSSLADAAQNVTTVLNVFNYQASQTADVANIMTAALNQSKLTMEQLTQGISYAANTAANAGVSFTELVASFGVLADAGIKSGSTLGTGYRKLITDLIEPTQKFKVKVAELGLNLDDLDVQTHGVTEVLNKLHDAGFTAADAMQTLDIRASAVAIPLLKGADTIGLFEQRLYLSQAAVQANETQMESLSNSLNKLQNSFGALIFDTFKSWVTSLASITTSLADFINGLGAARPVISALFQAMATIAGGAVILQISKLILGLSGIGVALTSLGPILSGTGLLFKSLFMDLEVTTVGMTALVAATTSAEIATVSLLPIIAAGAALMTFFGLAIFGTGNRLSGLNKEADEAKGKLALLRGEMDASGNKSKQLDDFISDLTKKHDELAKNSDALTAKILEGAAAFNGMGTQVIQLGDDIDTLITKAQALRRENLADELGKTKAYIGQLKVVGAVTNKQLDEQIRTQPDLARNISNPLQFDFEGNRTFGGELGGSNALLAERIADALAKNTPLTQIQALIGEVGSVTAKAVTDGDKNIETKFSQLSELLKTRAGVLGQQGISSIDQRQADLKLAGVEYSDKFGTQITDFLNKIERDRSALDKSFTSGIDSQGKPVTSGDAIATLKTIAATLKSDITQRSSNPAFINSAAFTAESSKLSQLNDDISKKVQQQDKSLTEIEKLDDKLYQQKIGNLEGEIKVSTVAQARIIAAQAEQEADKVRQNKKAEAERFVNSNAFKAQKSSEGIDINSPAFKDIKDKTLTSMLNDADEAFKSVKQRVDNAVLNKEANSQIAGNKEVRTAIDDLRDSIRATNTAYKTQIELLAQNVNHLKAFRSALDLPNNAPYVTDAARAKADEEIQKAEADQAIADKNLAIARLATQQADLRAAENLAGITYEQASAARARATEGGGDPGGRVASSSFSDEKSQNSKARATVLSQGDAILGTKKKLDEATIAAEKYTLAIDKSNDVFATFTATFEYFQKSNVYGPRAMGQDFLKLFQDIQTGFGTVVTNFINGTKSISKSFRDLATSIVSSLEQIAIKSFSQSLFTSALGTAATATAPATSGFLSGILGSIGKTLGFASGGLVRGGTPGVDSVPIMAMSGEGVLNSRAVNMIGTDTLNRLNNGNVDLNKASSLSQDTGGDGSKRTVNVYIVTPDQVPGLGPNDVIALVSQNISTGGSLKSLIKQVTV